MLNDEAFRARLAGLLSRTGLSQRSLSAAFGRDPSYVQALLDPSRPSRARPTPDDLARAADATGTTFVELLVALWGIDPARLASEVRALGVGSDVSEQLGTLAEREQILVLEFIEFLGVRQAQASTGRAGRS